MKLSEIVNEARDALSLYKLTPQQGAYHFKHYEGPDGSFVQIREGNGPFHAAFQTPDGNIQEFESFEELESAVNQHHNR